MRAEIVAFIQAKPVSSVIGAYVAGIVTFIFLGML